MSRSSEARTPGRGGIRLLGPVFSFGSAFAVRAVVADQPGGGGILRGDRRVVACDRAGQLVRQLLAELHTPLVEGRDPPHPALHEGAVLVQGDELAGHGRRQLRGHDRGGGAVAGNSRAATSGPSVPSARTSSAVLPKASALVWAKKFARNSSCTSWSPSVSGWFGVAKAMKSAGITRVP